jgi:hypothetical protein
MTTYQLNSSAKEMVYLWSTSREIPFKGKLISRDDDGKICMCAQGQVLYKNGYSEEQLFDMSFSEADKETARILGISTIHSRFLRIINDNLEGSPQDVISNPEKYLGPNWEKVLEFWWYIDTLSEDEIGKMVDRYLTIDVDITISAAVVSRHVAEEVVGWEVRDAAWSAANVTPNSPIFAYATLELIGGNIENKLRYDLIMNR